VATTRSRPRGRETARPNTGGPVAEHLPKIYGVAIVGVIVIVAFLALTSVGHVVDLAVQHFMLFYAGVFALIALCASVGAGLISTDRMFLHPGHRVMMQSIHRAVSFGALVFLIIHIVTEILAQRIHVIDAFIPFLVPFKTFYIGLGTISSDLIILIVITGVLRKRFTSNGKNVWRWRAIHYTAYLSFVFGVWHGLLGGRAGKPYVDWSYGFVVAFVALGLAVRILANSLRPKETLSSAPVAESASSGSAPVRAATMYAQLGAARATGPLSMSMSGAAVGLLPGGARSGPMPAMAALPAAALPSASGYPQATVVQGSAQTLAAPIYEPGYDGPPRYAGTPRNSGPMPRVPGGPSGPQRRPATGPMPGAPSGPMPRVQTGPMPRATTGPLPRAAGGPVPRVPSGPMPQAPGAPSGPRQRPMTGPMPATTGSMPRVPGGPGGPSGPQRRPATGPMPRGATGPMPRAATGPTPRMPTGPMPRVPGDPGRGGPRYGGQQFTGQGYDGPQYGGPGYGGPSYDGPGYSSPEYGQPYDGPQYDVPRAGGAGGQVPWDDGFPETDPNLKYRAPGPGMPGYRVPGDWYRGSDDWR
jgi:hypothetical protein